MELFETERIGSDMKRDGRTLDRATLETIRLMAIERVREGEAPAEVMASFGISYEGYEHISELMEELVPPANAGQEQELLVSQALQAIHCYQCDREYLVRDGKIEIIDANTGRAQPDHAWERGLHQMIEAKEGCELTPQRETIARMSYQRFFRRYLHLGGMAGTASEVAAELWSVYRQQVVRIPTRVPSCRVAQGTTFYASAETSGRAWPSARRHCSGAAGRH